jgi:hypothetical protein
MNIKKENDPDCDSIGTNNACKLLGGNCTQNNGCQLYHHDDKPKLGDNG